MPTAYSAGISTVTSSAIDGTETMPVYVSAVVAQAELAGLAGTRATDPLFTPVSISAITLAALGVFTTAAAHGLQIGDRVYIDGIVGTTQCNARSYIVNTVPTTTTFTLKTYGCSPNAVFYNTYNVLSTVGYTAWSSGGTVYRLMRSFTATNLELRPDRNPAGWLCMDRECEFVMRGSTWWNPQGESTGNANNGGATCLHYHSTVSVETTTSRANNQALACSTGGRFVCLRAPTGQNPQVVHIAGNVRNDWPNIYNGLPAAEIIVEGLTKITYLDSQKWYIGTSRNAGARDKFSNMYLGGNTTEMFQINGGATNATSVYVSPIVAVLTIAGDTIASNMNVIAGIFGVELTTTANLNWTSMRAGRAWLTDPVLNFWNGSVVQAGATAGSFGGVRYTNLITVKNGATPIQNANIRRKRTVRVAGAGYDLSTLVYLPEVTDRYVLSDVNGQSSVTCADNLLGHTVGGVTGLGAVEFYRHTCQIRSYLYDTPGEYVYQNRIYGFGGTLGPVTEEVQVVAANAITLSQAAAAALTGITLAAIGSTGGTITISSAHTLDEVWCFWRNFQSISGNQDSFRTWTYDGATLNVGAWDVVISSGGSLSGTTLTTTGVITNSGTLTLATYSGSGGTFVLLGATGLVVGSRYQFYNVTDSVEVSNGVAAASSVSQYFQFTANKSIRLRLTYTNGATAKAAWVGASVLTASGLSFLAAQIDNLVYNANAIDGSLVTEFAADYPNVQIDISDPDNTTTMQRLYAWSCYNETSSQGVASFVGALTATDVLNYNIDQTIANILLDNRNTAAVYIRGGYLYRADGSPPVAPASIGNIYFDSGIRLAPQPPTAAVDVADAILKRNLAGGANGGHTVQDALRASRNKVEIIGTTLNVYKEDGVTVAWTAPITTAVRDALQSVSPP